MSAPVVLRSPAGLEARFTGSGALGRLSRDGLLINLFLGNETEGGLANVYLRLGDDGGWRVTPLTGPRSRARFGGGGSVFRAAGREGEMEFEARFVLAAGAMAWFWHVRLRNTGGEPVRCALAHTQDVGLADYAAARLNEYYVSHYVDHTPLWHERRGVVVASRQNQRMGGGNPWLLQGSLRRGVSFATDALQVYGLAARAGGGGVPAGLAKGLPGSRLQHEHSLVAVEDEAVELAPGEEVWGGFWGLFVEDHPEASGEGDLERVAEVLGLPEAAPPGAGGWAEPVCEAEGREVARSVFVTAPVLETLPLEEAEVAEFFPGERRHEERGEGGLWSFFRGARAHVALRAKELAVLRPHGQILRTGSRLTPDEASLTSTVWMAGVFHSMVTQGHVSINRFLSGCHTYLGLFRSHGLRVFADAGGGWRLLDVPSAFEMRPEECRWVYKHAGGVLELRARAAVTAHRLGLEARVARGGPVRFLVTQHVALNGDDGVVPGAALWERRGDEVVARPVAGSEVGRRFPEGSFVVRLRGGVWEAAGGDELLYEDGVGQGEPFVCLRTGLAEGWGLEIEGRLVGEEQGGARLGEGFWDEVAGPRIEPPAGRGGLADVAGRIAEILPWFVQNALVHYLAPRGLEQYSGGGWGTRDVCQGAVELLLALGRLGPLEDVLRRVFRQQNPDGDWPQWFMFFERERLIRPGDSHGDVVFWPLLALAEYLEAGGDAGFLEERLPFFDARGEEAAELGTVREHVERALGLIRRRVVPGTRLAVYGHGDWNDAMQPARPELRERLCSAWTVTLQYQTLRALGAAWERAGRAEEGAALREEAEGVLGAFRELLMADGIPAGLVYFDGAGGREFLLHPRDGRTGLRFSLLPLVHGVINGMFTPEEAEAVLGVIRRHLMGPDGARLFDRPLVYRGGLQTLFQRAESASYFGREIGLMYAHAHLRYCEALARVGRAGEFVRALGQVVPVGVGEAVPAARPRQGNCYYSSSDGLFADRYEAQARYEALLRGEAPLEGGWRVYSSGPGIAVRLVTQCLLGIRPVAEGVCLDPVMPRELSGLRAVMELGGRRVEVEYEIKERGCGPVAVEVNGEAVSFRRETNPYRPGGVVVTRGELERRVGAGRNRMVIRVG